MQQSSDASFGFCFYDSARLLISLVCYHFLVFENRRLTCCAWSALYFRACDPAKYTFRSG